MLKCCPAHRPTLAPQNEASNVKLHSSQRVSTEGIRVLDNPHKEGRPYFGAQSTRIKSTPVDQPQLLESHHPAGPSFTLLDLEVTRAVTACSTCDQTAFQEKQETYSFERPSHISLLQAPPIGFTLPPTGFTLTHLNRSGTLCLNSNGKSFSWNLMASVGCPPCEPGTGHPG